MSPNLPHWPWLAWAPPFCRFTVGAGNRNFQCSGAVVLGCAFFMTDRDWFPVPVTKGHEGSPITALVSHNRMFLFPKWRMRGKCFRRRRNGYGGLANERVSPRKLVFVHFLLPHLQ